MLVWIFYFIFLTLQRGCRALPRCRRHQQASWLHNSKGLQDLLARTDYQALQESLDLLDLKVRAQAAMLKFWMLKPPYKNRTRNNTPIDNTFVCSKLLEKLNPLWPEVVVIYICCHAIYVLLIGVKYTHYTICFTTRVVKEGCRVGCNSPYLKMLVKISDETV